MSAYDVSQAETVLAELQDPGCRPRRLERIEGRGGQAPRLFLSTRQTLNMLFRASSVESVPDGERDEEFVRVVDRFTTTGPFKSKLVVEAKAEEDDPGRSGRSSSAAGIDDARNSVSSSSTLGGSACSTASTARLATPSERRWAWRREDPGPVGLFGRIRCREYAAPKERARRRHSTTSPGRGCRERRRQGDEDMKAEAAEKRSAARKAMDDAVDARTSTSCTSAEAKAAKGRADKEFRFEQDNQSALDGGSRLGEAQGARQRPWESGSSPAKALLHNLTDGDYARPLDEVRDLFWSAPRMPLLPRGDADLQRAIFEAITAGCFASWATMVPIARCHAWADCGGSGVTSPGQAQRKRSPRRCSLQSLPEPPQPPVPQPPKAKEIQLRVSLNASLDDRDRRSAIWKLLDDLRPKSMRVRQATSRCPSALSSRARRSTTSSSARTRPGRRAAKPHSAEWPEGESVECHSRQERPDLARSGCATIDPFASRTFSVTLYGRGTKLQT